MVSEIYCLFSTICNRKPISKDGFGSYAEASSSGLCRKRKLNQHYLPDQVWINTKNAMTKSLVFAHRGANKEAAENTRAAFDKALQYPIDGIETDVQLSRDEVAVLWHDRFLGKLGYPLKHIDDFDYAQLQAMNFAAHFSSGAKPEGIMSLQGFLDAYRQRCRLLLEIKNRDWESPSRHEIKVRQTLEMAGEPHGDNIMISSFNLDSLIYAHQCAPQFPLVYNFEPEQTLKDAQRVLDYAAFSARAVPAD